MFLNKNLQIVTLISLCVPTIACSMKSDQLLSSDAGERTESISSPTSVHSPSSNSSNSFETIPIHGRNSEEEPLLREQTHNSLATVASTQKRLLVGYAIGASLVAAFLTGFSMGNNNCHP